MKKSFRRGFLLGIGLARLTANKVKSEVRKFAKENDLNKKEADQLAGDFVKKVNRERKQIMAKAMKEASALKGRAVRAGRKLHRRLKARK